MSQYTSEYWTLLFQKCLQMPLEKAFFAMLVCPSVDTDLTSEFSRFFLTTRPSTAAKGLNF